MTETETNPWESIGTHEISKGKAFMYLSIVILIFLCYWFSGNLADEKKKAESFWYFGLGLLFLGVVGLKWSIGTKTPIFSVCIYENETASGELSNRDKTILIGFSVIIFFSLVFLTQFRGEGLISAPTFQVIELDATGNALYMFALTAMEDIVFVGVMFAMIFGTVYAYTKNSLLALCFALLLSPSIFMFYHIARYGYDDMMGSLFVFSLNFVSIIWVAIFRNILLPLALHGGNNVGLMLVKVFGIAFDPIVSVGILIGLGGLFALVIYWVGD